MALAETFKFHDHDHQTLSQPRKHCTRWLTEAVELLRHQGQFYLFEKLLEVPSSSL